LLGRKFGKKATAFGDDWSKCLSNAEDMKDWDECQVHRWIWKDPPCLMGKSTINGNETMVHQWMWGVKWLRCAWGNLQGFQHHSSGTVPSRRRYDGRFHKSGYPINWCFIMEHPPTMVPPWLRTPPLIGLADYFTEYVLLLWFHQGFRGSCAKLESALLVLRIY
jgi:hypothetical protein